MDQDKLFSSVGRSYAEALLQLAQTQSELPGGAEIIGQQIGLLRKIIRDEPLAIPLLVDPAIGLAERHNLLDRLFKGRLADLLLKFLHVLCEKGRMELLNSICGAYQELLDESKGTVEADLTVAHRLDPAALETVRQRISAALKRDLVLHQYVDEKILGGLVLLVGDKLIDGSVRAQLAAMKDRFRAARPI
jgi:F-type H+-transporting ATPase subunit delta